MPGYRSLSRLAGQEEFLQIFQGLLLGEGAAVQVLLQVGIHVLVEAAEGIVVIPLAPQAEVQHPQALQRFREGAGRIGGHPVQGLGHQLPALLPGQPGVSGGQIQHRLNGLGHGLVIGRRLRGAGLLNPFQQPLEPYLQHLFIVGDRLQQLPCS